MRAPHSCCNYCVIVADKAITKRRTNLLWEIADHLHLNYIKSQPKEFDDIIIVKSRQTLDNYSDLKYFKQKDNFHNVRFTSEARKSIHNTISTFLQNNPFKDRAHYEYAKEKLTYHLKMADGYRVKVVYITSAGNKKGERIIHIPSSRIDEIFLHPEILMTKSEYNSLLNKQTKQELETKKHRFYDRVNDIIELANQSKRTLIVKAQAKNMDELMQNLFSQTINSIQRVKQIDSYEWEMFDRYIVATDKAIQQIVNNDKRISDYYDSEEFSRIKATCDALTQSQQEFNEYIDEKAQNVAKLFGAKIVRNETENEDSYNYVRPYKKTINPFAAEVSAHVFSSAENAPIAYIVKHFYPNKSQYKVQIEKLQLLIEELETLREAKVIIDNYKAEYEQYIQDVPAYVMDNDSDGFYSRLGLTIIDEAVLNVEYKFTYTSNGGMAQRSFTIPMTEETISELIRHLENKLTTDALVKAQRALMTSKLRMQIKRRDHFSCCNCGNSIHAEPNLLLEIDHIVPISKGGLTKAENLQTLCWKCNRSKGAKLT